MTFFISLLLTASALLAPMSAPQAMTDSMVAVINDKVITSRDVAGYVALSQRQFNVPDSSAPQFIQQNFAEVIEGEIKRQYAQSRNFTVTEAELNAATAQLAKANNMTPTQLSALTQGLTEPFQAKIATQILWDKVIQNELIPQINISTAEIDRIIRDILSGDVISEREISQIFIPTDDAQAKERIEQAAALLKQGTDFGVAAQQFGTGVSAQKGGYLGWFAEGALNPELEEALKAITVGETAGPLETDAGWHIVKIHRVKKAPAISFDPIEKLRLYEISVAVSSTIPLKKALEKNKFLADLQANKNLLVADKNWVPVSRLGAAAQQALPKNVGLSQIVATTAGERAFYVANRKREMADNLVRLRAKVESQLRGNKARMLERKFLRELRSRAFIELAPNAIERIKSSQ